MRGEQQYVLHVRIMGNFPLWLFGARFWATHHVLPPLGQLYELKYSEEHRSDSAQLPNFGSLLRKKPSMHLYVWIADNQTGRVPAKNPKLLAKGTCEGLEEYSEDPVNG